VVVGVDGSKTSAKAIDFAFDQAEQLHAKVVALHAWSSPFHTYADGQSMLLFDEQKIQDEARLLVAESVAGAAADHPDVQWTTELVSGSPAQALVRRSESADLLVLGTRGRGGFTGLLLGSVSQSVLHHTECPIAVVR
jgi:nucleotide-binding universal stress UspA family protein